MNRTLVAPLLLGIVASATLQAEEGGAGHYFPGSMASFMDGVSPTESFAVRLNVVDYSGGFGTNRSVPIGGQIVLDVDVGSIAYGLTTFWRPSWGSLGETWSYAISVTVPYVDLNVTGTVDATAPAGPMTTRRRDSETGLGDILLMPFMLNYHHSDDLNVNFRVAFYAPTGDYEVGRLANTGKNFWTTEPTVGLVYLGTKNGREASLYLGMDLNEENSATDYDSGNQLHVDATLAQHFPLWGGLAGAGATGYWYRQIDGDSGAGASLGAFKGESNGIGPVVSFTKTLGQDGQSILAEFKWIYEFDARRRPEGNILFLKIMLVL